MREPTRLTRVLQIALPAYFIVVAVIGWALLTPAITTSLATGERARGIVLIISLLLWSLLTAVLTYGSARRWRWTFWLYLVLLAWLLVISIRAPNPTTPALIDNLLNGLVEAALLVGSVVGLVRYGPWAMRKT